MSTTPNLGLTYLDPGQNQKEVTINANMDILDGVSWFRSPVDLTEAATIATDASLGGVFRVTLTADRTLGNPTEGTDGQRAIWEIVQDGSGGHTLALGSDFVVGGRTLDIDTDAGAHSFIDAIYNAGAAKWYVLGRFATMTTLNIYSNLGSGDSGVVDATGTSSLAQVVAGNGTSSLLWLQLFNAASVPSTGSTPLLSIPVGIGVASSYTEASRSFMPDAVQFTSGICYGWSSTPDTYTPASPSDQFVEVYYV